LNWRKGSAFNSKKAVGITAFLEFFFLATLGVLTNQLAGTLGLVVKRAF